MFSEFMPMVTPAPLLGTWGLKLHRTYCYPMAKVAVSSATELMSHKQQELLLPVGCSRGHSLDLPMWCFLCWRELLFISPVIPSGPRMVSLRVHWVDNLAF